MKAVVSTVSVASVSVGGVVVGEVDADRDGAGRGALLVLVAAGREDAPDAWRTMARKIADLRLLPAPGCPWDSPRDRSAVDNVAEVLVVSQFTLLGATAKGRRPSWSAAAPGTEAEPVIDRIVTDLRSRGLRVETGCFGATMEVSSVNQGPYTVLVDA
ncbi:D-aminoacyl-tRNA deacylase [Corynebacterium terpenotabidum]|uniref:D-tyrosyl-tRNA(Tyr) deacylase n=1 Tax=Corynebacterium terpenotabidum Y-11 TaxID=1200352 RepID=S4XGX5_9CORY|nr:D-aminoacyl-tRNA deacylase [Corynebacterium terpenotabidum]AGP30910.1 D-tyrosyl-tRNA(Tyr) deacylase [Corynebacterium terpenotabidum Y-11]